MHRPAVVLVAVLAAAGALALGPQAQVGSTPFDLLIVNARLIDGSGNPWRRADVGVRGDRIAAVGRLAGAPSRRLIDAGDRVVAPGFIDVHSHALDGLTRAELRAGAPLLLQGVTTVVGNPDGGGPVNLGEQREALASDGGIGVNAALLIGHGSVRRAVIGGGNRQPSSQDLDRMRAIVRQAVEDGAFGLSSGLFYTPGRFAGIDEVIALAREAGGVYASHIRDEGTYDAGLLPSVDEVIRVAETAGVTGIVTHVKALGPDSWGQSRAIVGRIEAARARGVDVWADQYPYNASSTSLAAALMPGETTEAAREAMAGPESRARFLALVRENIRRRGGSRATVIASGAGAPGLAGQNLETIATARGVSAEQAAVDIVLAGGASIVSFNMSDADVDVLMRQPWTMASSDGGLTLPGPSRPHPRNNGAFARRLNVYVRERGVLRLEDAIRGATSLSAHVFGLADRGEVRPGAFADLAVFSPDRVRDRATFESPHELAAGMDWVIVNGIVAVDEGAATLARAGRILKRAAPAGTPGGGQR